jgi:hypothetical protein
LGIAAAGIGISSIIYNYCGTALSTHPSCDATFEAGIGKKLAGELLMVATAELLEVQLTDPVMSGVVPSL